MISFHCFRDGKCEWIKGLQDFTFQFNEAFRKNYTLFKCLDVYDDKTKKQPEILLKSLGDKSMVIECKKIVYPYDFYKNHKRLHNLGDDFYTLYKSQLKPYLSNDAYELCINENALYKCKRHTYKISEQIALEILSYSKRSTTFDEIFSEIPIPWCFRRVPPRECDNASKPDFRLLTSVKSWLFAPDTSEAE